MRRNIVYRQPYTPDAPGLHRMLAFLLNRRHMDRIKLRDSDTAKRLGVTIDELARLQAAVEAEGLLFVRRSSAEATRTVYGFTDINNGADVK